MDRQETSVGWLKDKQSVYKTNNRFIEITKQVKKITSDTTSNRAYFPFYIN